MGFGDSIGSLFVDIDADTSGLEKGLDRSKSKLGGFSNAISGVMGAAAGGFGFGIAGAALDVVSSGFGAVTSSVIGTNAAMQDSKTAWGVLLGGAESAQAKLSELATFGANTPFEFAGVDKGAKLLQTFGGEALNTLANLTMVGDGASAANQPFEQVAFWTGRMYDAIQSGKPIGEAAAELQNMGLLSGQARNQLEQMQKEGAKGPEIWAKYTESQERFGGMMAEQSKNFNGRMSTMKDTLNALAAQAGKPIFDMLSNGLGVFNDLLSSPAVTTFATNLATATANGLTSFFEGATRLYNLLKTALMPLFVAIGPVINGGVGSASPVVDKLRGLWSQLMVAVQPAVPLVTTVAGLIGSLLVSNMRSAFAMIGGMDGAFKIVSGTITMFGGLIKTLSAIVVGVVGVVSNVLKGDWAAAWEAAKDMFTGAFDGIKQYLSGFGAVFGTLLANLANLAMDKAKAIGSAIVSGIAEAIKNGFSLVADAARNLAQSALNSAKDLLGIHSPSRAFMEVGKYAVAGFGVGFEKNAGLATSSVNAAMASTVDSAATASLAGSIGLSTGASTVVVNQSVAGSIMAERDLKELVIEAINEAQRRGRVAIGTL